jgi:site-specific DNA-methyltransferase (adenine-specific)
MSTDWKNQLYFGDNLDILKQLYEENPKGLIDLIYIDPPFNSKRNYNVLFESVDLTDSTAQKEAFADTWSNVSYMDTLNELSDLDISLYNFLKNLDNTNISKGAISYLVTMSVRLWYMQKLLNETGSFYLHCDPTMSHYLKILCDLIFGEKNFRNEVIWHYKKWSNVSTQFQRNHDDILFYSKSHDKNRVFNISYMPRAESTQKGFGDSLIISGYDDEGNRVPAQTSEELSKGVPQDDVWNINRVPPIKQLYPTEKPAKLLEKIIKASTSEGDIVADFFCGCGTTITEANRLNRKWLGVDISHLAVRLIAKRLVDSYGDEIMKTLEIHGFPKDIDSARELANNVKGGRLEFEDWIIEVLLHGITNERRNEMGFDGYRTFTIYDKKYIVMMEVKSGNASPTQLNHFIMTLNDKKGAIGVFICFEEHITRNMQVIAKKEGQFTDDFGNTHCDKIQVISVEDLLEGKRPLIPQSKFETFKKAEKKSTDTDTQIKIDL